MRFFDRYQPGNRNLDLSLFWEYDMNGVDLQKYRGLIATRVIQIGRQADFYAAFDLFGGIENFAKIAKNEVIDLSDKDLQFMCNAFKLKKEQTTCYKRKQLRKKLLIS